MTPYNYALFLFSISLGTTTTFASSNWLLAWTGLEINSLAILPIMAQNAHPRAVEATTKYFLVQTGGAATLLFATTLNAWQTGQWNILETADPFATSLITLALMFKLGLAPLHLWLPEVIQGCDLPTTLILSTIQKLAPFTVLMQIPFTIPGILITMSALSIVLGAWGALNQTQLRKIIAYSSIAHLGWVAITLYYSPPLSFLNLLIYFMLTSALILLFILNKATHINALSTTWVKAPALTALTPLVLLSLGGLPPLTGFMTKWLVIQELTGQGLALVATLTALGALLSLYFYLRITYAMALTISPNTLTTTMPWRLPPSHLTLPLAAATATSLLLLPLTPAAITLLAP
uniref:NADH-ubiquinone oxidoreductase chain 2 n=2 Tax=Bovichtus TaxID=36204 RepID=A0A1V1G3D9_9TELE